MILKISILDTLQASDAPTHVLQGHEGVVWSCAISRDSQLIVSGSNDRTIRIWCAKTGQVKERFTAHKGAVMCVDINKGSDMLASGGGWDDESFKMWSCGKGKGKTTLIDTFAKTGRSVRAVQFSPDGKKVVMASDCGHVVMWKTNTKSKKVALQYNNHSEAVYALAWSSDSKIVASGGAESRIHIWDAGKGTRMMLPLRGHREAVTSIVMDSKTETLVSASFDQTIKVWDFDKKNWKAEVKHTLKGHKGVVRSLALSPNDRFVASASEDGAVMVWEIASGHLVKVMTGHRKGIWSVKWSPDGRFIVSASRDGTIRVWGIDQQVRLCSFLCVGFLDILL